MIKLIGDTGSSEYAAAATIAEALEKLWPGISTSPASREHVRIASDVKISGYRVSDIDVVICGVFHRERKFIPNKTIHDKEGARLVRKPVILQNLVIAIEVKDHDETSVRITGDKVSVKYSRGSKNGWKSATDQNINQVHALHGYIKDLGNDAYIHRCLVMRGLAHIGIGGAVASGFDGVDLLTAVASVSKVNKAGRGYTLVSGPTSMITPILNAPIFRPIIPTALDRTRMDLIAASTTESGKLLENLGKKMVHLRGHGGTGKTVMFLQMAWKAFDERGLRTLVLTYNHALAADIRRLLSLLKVPSDPENGGIMVDTVMSFMYSWFLRLQLIEAEDLSYESYTKHCNTAIEMLNEGAITADDIKNITEANPDRYDYDCIVVDEAQDWPQGEVELLKTLYQPKIICLADGIDQLIRGKRPDWLRGVPSDHVELITLNRCLRMKRNLAVFVNEVADIGQLKWKVTPNDKAGGGKVKILLRQYPEYEALHGDLVADAKNRGNAELDFLFCVPPSSVSSHENRKASDIGMYLAKCGYEVWDGVDEISRKDFPRSKNQFRVVQYASCRGLEGWAVVLHRADQFWEHCKYIRHSQGLSPEEEQAFEDLDELSSRQAWHQVLIALTRPIDTLVIGLDDTSSDFSIALLEVAREHPEFIEIAS